MKEIDTETTVVWPSWCYSDNIQRNVLKECSEKDVYVIERSTDIEILSTYPSLRQTFSKQQTGNRFTNTTARRTRLVSVESEQNNRTNKEGNKTPGITTPPTITITKPESGQENGIGQKKMLSERSLLLSGYNNNKTIDSVKKNCDQSNISSSSLLVVPNPGPAITITPTSTAAAAAAFLYLEKVKNERMSPRVTAAQIDSLKDAIMESSAAAAVAAAMANNNNSSSLNNNNSSNSGGSNCNTIISNNNNNNNNNNNLVISQVQGNSAAIITSDDLQSHSLTQSSSHQQQQQQQQQHQHHQPLHMNSNHVKKERLSPGTNGDQQSTLSRSRSTTPSSFRGTSPQQSMHSSPSETLVPMHNLSTNLLNSIHQAATSASRHNNIAVPSSGISSASSGLPTDFSTRNYSDFMRSLAAKYNNANPNDSSNLRRNILFEGNSATSKRTQTSAQKTSSYSTSPATTVSKDVPIMTTTSLPPPTAMTTAAISPGESVLKITQQNKIVAAVANAAACSNNVSPYMTSFLSSLPFSPGIFPPLIDMSSTQALITLARAAKESEIHNILSPSQHPKRSTSSASPSPSPSLNIALQQAAQFVSPALIYSAQLQKQQQQHQQQVSRQSSPRLTNIIKSTSSSVSSKHPRNMGEKIHVSPLDLSSQPPASKRYKAESTSSQSSSDDRINNAIARRASSSTATTSPSPPPLNEKPSRTDASTTPFTPIKIATALSATSHSPALNVRQCPAQSEEVNSWTVDDVCTFVGSIDICSEYVKQFRDQCIDGSGLPLLTEDHLMNSLGMKLGPALKLRSVLAKKLGGPCPCVACVAQVQQVLALQTGGMSAAAVSTTSTTVSDNQNSGNNMEMIGNNCKSHMLRNTSSINNSESSTPTTISNDNSNYVSNNVNTTQIATTTANATNSNNTNICNSEGRTTAARSNSNNVNISNFSPSPPQPATHNICNSNNKNNNSGNRHDNADSSS